MDLKAATAARINELIEPVRKHFEDNKRARELLEKSEAYQITR
jgi:tyrosyl-tRNA synthetase